MADGGGCPGLGRRPPPGRSGVVGAVVLTGVFVGLLAAVAIGRSGDDPEAGTGPDTGAQTESGASTATTGLPATPQEAFTLASERLLSAGSFTYTGAVHATDVSRVRPGLWLAVDIMVTGEVDLTGGRVHETAVVPGTGSATETVTDGLRAWGRAAASTGELPAQPYQVISELSGTDPGRMGTALLPVWLRFTTGAQDAGLDPQGRPTYRAIVPAAAVGEVQSGEPPSDAQIVLTLDPSGEPVRVQLTSLPDGANLTLALDLAGIGAPVSIEPPVPVG
jgi:hypothetical protein